MNTATTLRAAAAADLDTGLDARPAPASARPLRPGDSVTLYLTGLGRKAQTFAEGAAPKVASPAVETVQVAIAGMAATVLYAGVQPQYPGLDQITVTLPQYKLPPGASTATVQIAVPATGQMLQYELNSF